MSYFSIGDDIFTVKFRPRSYGGGLQLDVFSVLLYFGSNLFFDILDKEYFILGRSQFRERATTLAASGREGWANKFGAHF